MVKKTEAPMPPAVVEKLLRAAGDAVLVGGQALTYWVKHYGVHTPADRAYITADSDFLARSRADTHVVRRFAQALGGQTHLPNKRALTSLVGQAYLEVSQESYLNVDVIFDVVGIDPDAVRKRAVQAANGCLVMHPLDVLRSRLANLHKLPAKQNELGVLQLQLAIDVGREFLRDAARRRVAEASATRSPLQPFVSEIERMAVEDAGRKVAKRHGVHVADAIDPNLIPAGAFWDKRWPALKALMSPAYAAQFTAPHPP
jgi:hypothetical protein